MAKIIPYLTDLNEFPSCGGPLRAWMEARQDQCRGKCGGLPESNSWSDLVAGPPNDFRKYHSAEPMEDLIWPKILNIRTAKFMEG
jgi:hypothetical protein